MRLAREVGIDRAIEIIKQEQEKLDAKLREAGYLPRLRLVK